MQCPIEPGFQSIVSTKGNCLHTSCPMTFLLNQNYSFEHFILVIYLSGLDLNFMWSKKSFLTHYCKTLLLHLGPERLCGSAFLWRVSEAAWSSWPDCVVGTTGCRGICLLVILLQWGLLLHWSPSPWLSRWCHRVEQVQWSIFLSSWVQYYYY